MQENKKSKANISGRNEYFLYSSFGEYNWGESCSVFFMNPEETCYFRDNGILHKDKFSWGNDFVYYQSKHDYIFYYDKLNE